MTRSGCGSITKLGENRYRVRVSLGKDGKTGKRTRVSRNVRGSYQDAREALIELEAEHLAFRSAPTDMTIGQYLEKVYLPAKRRQVEESEYARTTYAVLASNLKSLVVPYIGQVRMREFTPLMWDIWLSKIDSPFSRHTAASRFRTAWKQAIAWELLPDRYDITKKVKVPPRPRSDVKTATPELLAKILVAFKGHNLEPIVIVMSCCGLRLSEACALSWGDIDFRSETVEVRRSFHYEHGVYYFDKTKTPASSSVVSLPHAAAARLSEIRAARLASDDDAICQARNAPKREHPRMASRNWKRVYEKRLPEEPYLPIKSLRHTHATLLILDGVDISVVSKRLRHTDVSLTSSAYVRDIAAIDRMAAMSFDRILSLLPGNGAQWGPIGIAV